MTGKDRSPKADRNEGRIEGIPGRNLLSFERRVLEHGWTYEEGGRKYVQSQETFQDHREGMDHLYSTMTPPPPCFQVLTAACAEYGKLPSAGTSVSHSESVSQSDSQSSVSQSDGRSAMIHCR